MANIEANQESVASLTMHILEAVDRYLREKPTSSVDVFMSIHNAHVMIANNCAEEWKSIHKPSHTLRMADMTFRKAIRELRLPK